MGRHRGRGQLDTVKQLFRQNVFIAVICNTALSLLAFCFCKPLISLFTDSKEIIALAIPIMLVDIIIELCRGVNHISESSLNANGDVRATFLISVFSTWMFGVLLAYLLGITFGLGLIGIWIQNHSIFYPLEKGCMERKRNIKSKFKEIYYGYQKEL